MADMNLPNHPAIWHVYERAVVAMLNATDCTDDEAEEFIDSMVELIFTTMQTYLKETNATDHH
jgi:hypothetical protein